MRAIYLLLLFIAVPSQAKNLESWYRDKYCIGKPEYRLHDRTRVDCLTKTHAVEYEFARKWSEGIGQSLGYAFETNKRAGIVLILERKEDYKHWIKMNSIIDYYKLPIDTWVIKGWEIKK